MGISRSLRAAIPATFSRGNADLKINEISFCYTSSLVCISVKSLCLAIYWNLRLFYAKYFSHIGRIFSVDKQARFSSLQASRVSSGHVLRHLVVWDQFLFDLLCFARHDDNCLFLRNCPGRCQYSSKERRIRYATLCGTVPRFTCPSSEIAFTQWGPSKQRVAKKRCYKAERCDEKHFLFFRNCLRLFHISSSFMSFL